MRTISPRCLRNDCCRRHKRQVVRAEGERLTNVYLAFLLLRASPNRGPCSPLPQLVDVFSKTSQLDSVFPPLLRESRIVVIR